MDVVVLTSEQTSAFQRIRQRLDADRLGHVDVVAVSAANRVASVAGDAKFDRPAQVADDALGGDAIDDMRRSLIATWALGLPSRLQAEDLPDEVLSLYPLWIDRLAAFLTASEGPYDPDFWAKDVRFVLGLSVPATGCWIIDLMTPLGATQFIRHGLTRRDWAPFVAYLRSGGRGRVWLQTHLESRGLKDFTEESWDRHWEVAAALCERRPKLAGMLGSSWLLDPQLATVSPRLAYMRKTTLEGGSFSVDQGGGPVHEARAALKSPTRQALIASGDYRPRSWVVAWPRKALIAWATARKAPSMSEAA